MIEVTCNHDFADARRAAQGDGRALVIVFSSPDCQPCGMLKKRLETISDPASGALFLEVDVQQAGLVAQQYAVRSVPTVVVADSEGSPVFQRVGQVEPSEVKRKIHEALR